MATAGWWSMAFAGKVQGATNDVSRVDRTIIREPKYQTTPKYSLLTLGDSAAVKVWMVDDGPPLEPGKVRKLDSKRWDFEYSLDAITPSTGGRHTSFVLRRWNYNDQEDNYGLSLAVADKMPMYAGWFGTFWSTNRAEAPVIHLGGPFTPKLLRRKEFTIGETHERLSLCFLNPGSCPDATSRLSIEALPALSVPELKIQWPTAAGGPPLLTTHRLNQRCCYWEFYTTAFEVPKGVVPGMAKVTVELPAGAEFMQLTTTEMKMPVVSKSQEAER